MCLLPGRAKDRLSALVSIVGSESQEPVCLWPSGCLCWSATQTILNKKKKKRPFRRLFWCWWIIVEGVLPELLQQSVAWSSNHQFSLFFLSWPFNVQNKIWTVLRFELWSHQIDLWRWAVINNYDQDWSWHCISAASRSCPRLWKWCYTKSARYFWLNTNDTAKHHCSKWLSAS
jgi:hypothetical protein